MKYKTYIHLITTILLLMTCIAQAAETTLNFDQTECPDCTNGNFINGNEWETLGLSISNTYWYNDFRDTFDSMGLSITADGPATISFASAPSSLTFDYWVISGHQATFEAFDAAHNSLGNVFIDGSAGDVFGTQSFSGPISSLEWTGDRGYAQMSSLMIAAVPEPQTYMMLLIGFALIYFSVLRKQSYEQSNLKGRFHG